MKTPPSPHSHLLHFLSAFLSLLLGTGALATRAETLADIHYVGTDIEGRQNFQLEWNANVSGTYLVQSADDLSSSNNWKTVDAVESRNIGPIRWMAPESLRAQKFYRLVVPQPEIFSVAPGVVDTTVANQYLYILGQCLPTNADVVIDGLHFTPEIINSNGVWARILLNNLPPGQPVLDLSVIDLDTTNTVADYSHPFTPVDATSPYLLKPPTLPPGAPEPFIPLKGGAAAIAGYASQSARHIGGDCDDGNPAEPEVMPFSGEVQAYAVDMCIPGRGLDFVWARTYRSRTTSTDNTTGPRWTSSYDISVESLGNNMIVRDGTGRADTYFHQTNDVYTCPGFFRQGTLSNNVFRLTFADTGYWEFNPLDASPGAGKLARIVDRNGNILSLDYD